MSDDVVTVQRALRDLDTKDAIEILPAHVRKYSGRLSIRDFGARGDESDATQAFLDATDVLRQQGGGVLFAPTGRYGLSARVPLDFPCVLQGEHGLSSQLQLESGAGFDVLPHGTDVGGRGMLAQELGIRGSRQRYLAREPGTPTAIGDRRRPYAPLPLGSLPANATFPAHEADRGCHLRCVQAGTTGPSELLDVPLIVPGTQITDGTVIWQVEIDAAFIVESAYVRVKYCDISNFDDAFVLVLGTAGNIADNTTIEHNHLVSCDGAAIYATGIDANVLTTRGNHIQDCNVGIRDAGFLSSSHGGNNVVVNCRWSYVGESSAAQTEWHGNYAENSGDGSGSLFGGAWLAGSHDWRNGNVDRFDPRSQGNASNALRQGRVWLDVGAYTRLLGGQGHEWEEWSRRGDGSQIKDAWVLNDAADPGGYLRQAWLGAPGFEVREITSPRSQHGAGRWRFPRGYYVGKDRVYLGALDHKPTELDLSWTGTNVYHQGARILNSKPTLGAPEYWIALRDGGWGGGRQWGSVHTWLASHGDLAPGDSLEPLTANGHVYRVLRIEENVKTPDGQDHWQIADIDHCVTSATEPTWTTGPGDLVYETGALISRTTPGAAGCRIVYQEHGLRGMRWGDGPTITNFEDV